jgi:hypothetical protein
MNTVPPRRRYFAKGIPGLESVLAKEISDIGGHGIEMVDLELASLKLHRKWDQMMWMHSLARARR